MCQELVENSTCNKYSVGIKKKSISNKCYTAGVRPIYRSYDKSFLTALLGIASVGVMFK